MTDYTKLVEALRCGEYKPECGSSDCPYWSGLGCMDGQLMEDAAAAIEALQAEVKRLQDKLCDWCAVCPKERRKPEDCELLSETPLMYGPSDAVNVEVQDDK